jgi:CheY-like chemotaxis protein
MATSTPKVRVLVADDEWIIADSLAQILELSGFTARAVYSGEEAVEIAQELNPDVLITDVIMNGMNGIQAARRIQEACSSCKIILISGHAATTNLLRDSDGHGFQILCKPVYPTVILESCRKVELSSELIGPRLTDGTLSLTGHRIAAH